MKRYISDAVALARYFEDHLPTKADRAFKEAEDGNAKIFIPSIVIGEFVYIALKGRLKFEDPRLEVRELLDELLSSPYFEQIEMSSKAWNYFLESSVPELHDRMIHSIAISLDPPPTIITNDPSLAKVFPTLW